MSNTSLYVFQTYAPAYVLHKTSCHWAKHHNAGVFQATETVHRLVTFPSTISRWPSILLFGYFSTAMLCKDPQSKEIKYVETRDH